jgi:hypothetical protein
MHQGFLHCHDGGDLSPDANDDAIADPFLARLESMVRLLIGGEYSGGEQLWQLQLDLLELQGDVQAEIASVKSRRLKDTKYHADLRALRWTRQQARRFGDAIAWLYLGLNRKLIYPLANNVRVTAASDTHGKQAATALAVALSNEGWGFPLLHDITDCLRIGDVTFIGPDDIHTVEAKTQVIEEAVQDDGRTSTSYRVTLISASPLPTAADSFIGRHIPDDRPPSRYLTEPPPRVVRQIERMNEARAHQDAEPNRLHSHASKLFITTETHAALGDNTPAMVRVVESAYATGYGSEAVEDTFLYVAFYASDGLSDEVIKDERLIVDLQSSGILFEDPERNSLVVSALPTNDRRGAELYLPYYLLPLPLNAVVDMMRNRLVVLILTNGGRIVSALEKAGFKITNDSSKSGGFSFIASSVIDSDDLPGRHFNIELHNLHRHVSEMICEFGSVRNLVGVADAMTRVSRLAIRDHGEPGHDRPASDSK